MIDKIKNIHEEILINFSFLNSFLICNFPFSLPCLFNELTYCWKNCFIYGGNHHKLHDCKFQEPFFLVQVIFLQRVLSSTQTSRKIPKIQLRCYWWLLIVLISILIKTSCRLEIPNKRIFRHEVSDNMVVVNLLKITAFMSDTRIWAEMREIQEGPRGKSWLINENPIHILISARTRDVDFFEKVRVSFSCFYDDCPVECMVKGKESQFRASIGLTFILINFCLMVYRDYKEQQKWKRSLKENKTVHNPLRINNS